MATTLLVGLGLVTSIPETCEYFIGIYIFGLAYIIWIATVLSFTAYSTLLWKLCAQTCSCCMRRQSRCVNRTPKQQAILTGSGVPALNDCAAYILVLGNVLFNLWDMRYFQSVDSILISITLAISALVGSPAALLLTLIGCVILLVWFCARRKLIARRRCAVLFVKELVMWFMYFIVNILISIAYFFYNYYRKEIRIGLIIVITIAALYPYFVLGYLLYSFRNKRVQHVNNQIQVDGTNLVTAHPTKWFSLTTTDAAV